MKQAEGDEFLGRQGEEWPFQFHGAKQLMSKIAVIRDALFGEDKENASITVKMK